MHPAEVVERGACGEVGFGIPLTFDDVDDICVNIESQMSHGGEGMATINLRDFPEDLHQAAKIKAVMDKTTLREIIIRALREYVKQPGERSRKKGG